MKKMNSFLLLLSLILAAVSCKKNNGDTTGIADTYNNLMILKWNEAAATAVGRTAGIPPMTESRVYAMVNVAVHDALNNIVKKYNTYALTTAADLSADPDAAVAEAAHDVLVNLMPPQQAFADSVLNVSLAAIPGSTAKDNGISLGRSSAAAMLGKRTNDGASVAQYTIVQGTLPGQYQSTPPLYCYRFCQLSWLG